MLTHAAEAQVNHHKHPEVEVAIPPQQLGDSRTPQLVHEVHAVYSTKELDRAENRRDECKNLGHRCMHVGMITRCGCIWLHAPDNLGMREEDVVQTICLLCSQHLLILQHLVLLLFSQSIMQLLDASCATNSRGEQTETLKHCRAICQGAHALLGQSPGVITRLLQVI